MAKNELQKPASRFSLILVLVFLFPAEYAFCNRTSVLPEPVKQVLVIHSYYPTFTWTNSITKGIRKDFNKKWGQEACIYFEFLDAKRHPGKEYLKQQAELLRMKYPDPGAIEVIICSDDQALNFLLDRSDTLFKGIPVVFCGVNGYSLHMRKHKFELTGVIEAIDPKSTLEAALRLQPNVREVLVITDITLTGQAIEKTARQTFEPFRKRLYFRYVSDMTMAELQTEVSTLSDDSIVLLFVFNRDNMGRNFTHENSLRKIADHFSVPIYSFWNFYLGQGIVGGMLSSGELHGKTAAQLALRILNGERAQDIPVVMESPNSYIFDYQQLLMHNLPLDRIPAGSKIINKPESLYQKYRYRIWIAVSFLLLQTAIIILLLMNIRKRRRAEKASSSSENKFRSFFDLSPEAIALTDVETGELVDVNNMFCSLSQYSREEIIGKRTTEIGFFSEKDRAEFVRRLKSTGEVHGLKMEFKTRNGTTLSELMFSKIIQIAGRDLTLTIFLDVTEQQRLEGQLQLAKKMEAIGTLAGGVAHDLNNPQCCKSRRASEPRRKG